MVFYNKFKNTILFLAGLHSHKLNPYDFRHIYPAKLIASPFVELGKEKNVFYNLVSTLVH